MFENHSTNVRRLDRQQIHQIYFKILDMIILTYTVKLRTLNR